MLRVVAWEGLGAGPGGPTGPVEWEGELLDRFVLALPAPGLSDEVVVRGRRVLEEFVGFVGCRVWEVRDRDVDRWLVWLRGRGLAGETVYLRSMMVARFYTFLTVRYKREVWERTGLASSVSTEFFVSSVGAGASGV